MNRVVMFIIFICLVSLVYFGMHFFVYKAIVKSLALSKSARTFLKWFLWISGVSFFLANLLGRVFRFYLLHHYAYAWLGVLAIAFSVFLIQWLLGKLFPGQVKLLAVAALCAIGVMSAYSLYNGLKNPVVRRMEIPLKGLPAHMAGFSIVQLSDLHLEVYKSKKTVAAVIDTVNSLDADLVVFTGDLIDSDVCEDPYLCDQLSRLKARYGAVAVTGNHEFYAGIETFMQLTRRWGIKVLRNEKTVIADTLQIIGIDDGTSRQFSQEGPSKKGLIERCDSQKPIILLSHRPEGFDEAAAKGVGLQLSGHTHAGQLPPMELIVRLIFKYPFGLYEKNGSYIYTSCGTGYWGPPMRLFSRPEIPLFILRPGR